jgi:RimJ/RimL family protein N-acetyltransferase
VLTRDECNKEAKRRAQDNAFFAVCLAESGKLIGNQYLQEQDHGTWELGFVFNHAYQGKGYAHESTARLLAYAFTDLGAHRVAAYCNPENEKSWHLLERLQMRREGHLVKNIYFKNDVKGEPLWQDTYEYAILKAEWQGI